jgi:apolipoprotein N-acyltransferase
MPLPLAKRWVLIGSSVLAVWILISLVQYNRPLDTPSVRAAAIQPAISPIITANQNQTEKAINIRNRMLEQSQTAAQDGAQLIVWPEGALM